MNLSGGNDIVSILLMNTATIRPAMIWNRNFTPGGILRKSSTAPSPRTMKEAGKSRTKSIDVRKSFGKKKKSIPEARRRTRLKARNIDTPPDGGWAGCGPSSGPEDPRLPSFSR